MAGILTAVALLLLASCLVQASHATVGVCPESWTKHGGLCYKKMMEPKTYIDARCECAKHGAIVATLSTPAKTDFINTWVNGTMDKYVLGADRLRGDWFVWMDGVPLDNTTFNWAPNQPDNKQNKENYLAYVTGKTPSGHAGVDVGPKVTGVYFCEKSAADNSSDRRWKRRSEGVLYPNNVMSQHSLPSKLMCGGQCMVNCLCYSFSYNSLNRTCTLYNAYYRRLSGSTLNDEQSVLYD